jgi:RNA polymerase sigma factor (sigma-70 family)
VSNKALNHLTRRRELPSDQIPDVARDDLGFLRFEEDKRFFARVDTLPVKQRATLVLRYYADLDDKAIAELLDCSVQTVRSQAHHGLAKLRERETGGES